MKSFLKYFIVLLFIQLSGGNVCKAQVSAEGMIFAEIIPALTATETAQLNFGRFSPTTQGGKVILSPDGSRMSTGTVVLTQGPHQSARFYVTGEDNAAYSITLPPQPTTLMNVNNSKSIIVSDYVSTPGQGAGTGLLAGGAQEVRVGATLNVGPVEQNPVGLYSGTFIIRFDYN
ncbi:MAG: DUF4402 domain-containing protein [Syntrophothermus sp.]